MHSIAEAEPLGPAKPMEALIIAPCTGNTMAKINHGITDTAVTMAAKAHLRNSKPLVIAFSTNDALSGSAPNIAGLLNRKNVYFVPFRQDDPVKKPFSMASDFSLIAPAVESALAGKQLQPLLAAVSYTHLEVCKRQALDCLKDIAQAAYEVRKEGFTHAP